MTIQHFSPDCIPASSRSFCFLAGVHGVGKTTLCNRYFHPAGFYCTTASSLIKKRGKAINKDKRVTNVEDNQLALLEQLRIERDAHEKLLLDGHFCLVSSSGEIVEIDPSIFQAMGLDSLILIKGDPEEIAARLHNRDSNKWSPRFLREFQEAEERHAHRVSKEISVSLNVYLNLNKSHDWLK